MRFFASCKHINPYDFKVSTSNMIFYNSNTDEIYEVRYNNDLMRYQIFKGGEVVYEDEITESKSEENVYTERKDKPLVRKLVKDEDENNHNYAFVTNGFLILNLLILFFIVAMIIFFIK